MKAKVGPVSYADVNLDLAPPRNDNAPLLDVDAILGDRSISSIKRGIEQHGVEYIKIAVSDIDGILRGKYIKAEKFISALEGNISFCDVVFGWDSNDQLYDNVTFTGWHTAYPDAQVRLLIETARAIPFEPNTLFILGEFIGHAETVCPRAVLRRVVERAEAMNFSPQAACEFEFFMFKETPESVREKNYQDLVPITPGYFGYSVLRSSVHAEFYKALLDLGRDMRFPLEALHTETGPGVLEAAIMYGDALESADRAALFKTFTKVLAQRRGWMATFMAKWSNKWPGQSGHIHLSLRDKKTGKSMFYDKAGGDHNMSDTMRWFIGGQQALMPEILAMVAGTVNSYSRMIPGFWAPTSATWGVENRTCALRAIPGAEKSQRVEYRIAAADINPYIAMAAALGSGLWGIENKIEPTAPVQGNAYEQTFPEQMPFPKTLSEAAERLRHSKAAKELFGESFV